jgi:hypothetical protein
VLALLPKVRRVLRGLDPAGSWAAAVDDWEPSILLDPEFLLSATPHFESYFEPLSVSMVGGLDSTNQQLIMCV